MPGRQRHLRRMGHPRTCFRNAQASGGMPRNRRPRLRSRSARISAHGGRCRPRRGPRRRGPGHRSRIRARKRYAAHPPRRHGNRHASTLFAPAAGDIARCARATGTTRRRDAEHAPMGARDHGREPLQRLRHVRAILPHRGAHRARRRSCGNANQLDKQAKRGKDRLFRRRVGTCAQPMPAVPHLRAAVPTTRHRAIVRNVRRRHPGRRRRRAPAARHTPRQGRPRRHPQFHGETDRQPLPYVTG